MSLLPVALDHLKRKRELAMKTLIADICVIGGGSGGLSVAAGVAQLGASTVLFERDRMGGDCLNTGCVPSKALLAAGNLRPPWLKPVMGVPAATDHQLDFRQNTCPYP